MLADACRERRRPCSPCSATTTTTARCAAEIAATLDATRASSSSTASHVVLEVAGMEVGVVGTKGFVGGFPGAEIPDFGEPLLREVYAETSREVEALEAGLEAVAGCERRLVLLHYAPVTETDRRRAGGDLGIPRLRPTRRPDRRAPAGRGVPRPRAPRPAGRRDRHRARAQRRAPRASTATSCSAVTLLRPARGRQALSDACRRRASREAREDRITTTAQALAYSLFLAIPATFLLLLGVFSLVADARGRRQARASGSKR